VIFAASDAVLRYFPFTRHAIAADIDACHADAVLFFLPRVAAEFIEFTRLPCRRTTPARSMLTSRLLQHLPMLAPPPLMRDAAVMLFRPRAFYERAFSLFEISEEMRP